MTQARAHIVSKHITPYYHIMSCCVRRTFLCGYDKASKRDYEHRRQWIVDRIRLLSSVFAIDICSYAVMTDFCSCKICIHPVHGNKQSLSYGGEAVPRASGRLD